MDCIDVLCRNPPILHEWACRLGDMLRQVTATRSLVMDMQKFLAMTDLYCSRL